MDDNTKIAIFKGKEIRKTIHKNEWWFSVVDVVESLTGSVDNVPLHLKNIYSEG